MKGDKSLKRSLSSRSDSNTERNDSCKINKNHSTSFKVEKEQEAHVSGGSEHSAVIQDWLREMETRVRSISEDSVNRDLVNNFSTSFQLSQQRDQYLPYGMPEMINKVDEQLLINQELLDSTALKSGGGSQNIQEVHFTPKKVREMLSLRSLTVGSAGEASIPTYSQEAELDIPLLNIGTSGEFEKKIKENEGKAREILERRSLLKDQARIEEMRSEFAAGTLTQTQWDQTIHDAVDAENEYSNMERDNSNNLKTLLANQVRYKNLMEASQQSLNDVARNPGDRVLMTTGKLEVHKTLENYLKESKAYEKPLEDLKIWFDNENTKIREEIGKRRLKLFADTEDDKKEIKRLEEEIKDLNEQRGNIRNDDYYISMRSKVKNSEMNIKNIQEKITSILNNLIDSNENMQSNRRNILKILEKQRVNLDKLITDASYTKADEHNREQDQEKHMTWKQVQRNHMDQDRSIENLFDEGGENLELSKSSQLWREYKQIRGELMLNTKEILDTKKKFYDLESNLKTFKENMEDLINSINLKDNEISQEEEIKILSVKLAITSLVEKPTVEQINEDQQEAINNLLHAYIDFSSIKNMTDSYQRIINQINDNNSSNGTHIAKYLSDQQHELALAVDSIGTLSCHFPHQSDKLAEKVRASIQAVLSGFQENTFRSSEEITIALNNLTNDNLALKSALQKKIDQRKNDLRLIEQTIEDYYTLRRDVGDSLRNTEDMQSIGTIVNHLAILSRRFQNPSNQEMDAVRIVQTHIKEALEKNQQSLVDKWTIKSTSFWICRAYQNQLDQGIKNRFKIEEQDEAKLVREGLARRGRAT